MIDEEIKDTLKELTLEDLGKVTWDYSDEGIAGLYEDNIIRLYLWETKECGSVNPLLVGRCNVEEGWVEYIEVEEPEGDNIQTMLKKLKRDEAGGPIRTKVNCKVVVDLLDAKGNVVVTVS